MDWQSKKAQYTVCLVSLLLTTMVASTAYHHLREEMVLYRWAETALTANHLSEAISLYRQAITAGLQDLRVQLRLAEAYLSQGDAENAIRELEVGLDLQPDNQYLIGELARLYGETGQVDKGVSLANRLPESPAVRFTFWLRLGDAGVAKQEISQAALCYRNALASNPGQIAVTLKLAAALSWLRNYDEALSLYEEVLASQPGNRVARLGLARVLGWAGRLDEAILQYRKLLEKDA